MKTIADYEKKVKWIDKGGMEQTGTLEEYLLENAYERPTPLGVRRNLHLRTDGEPDSTGNELWEWGFRGQHPEKIEEFETHEEAYIEMLDAIQHEISNRDNVPDYEFIE